jgi:uncharacterized SAM-binding protein YcdF (DUF218 family)
VERTEQWGKGVGKAEKPRRLLLLFLLLLLFVPLLLLFLLLLFLLLLLLLLLLFVLLLLFLLLPPSPLALCGLHGRVRLTVVREQKIHHYLFIRKGKRYPNCLDQTSPR